MALPAPTLVVEDGSGLADANSYASVATADAYVGARPFGGTEWDAVDETQRVRLLIAATQLIDSNFTFRGSVRSVLQRLQWPRIYVPNPDVSSSYLTGLSRADAFIASETLPAMLVQATCEQALQILLAGKINADPSNQGIHEIDIAESIRVVFEKGVENGSPIPTLIQKMLGKLGSYNSSVGGAVRLTRV